jgi:hypothetical protein
MRPFPAIAAALVLASMPFPTIPATPEGLDELQEVVVRGLLSWSPLWRVSSGEHVLWILPLIDACPGKMEWESDRIKALISQSEEFIDGPSARMFVPGDHRRRLVAGEAT